ncbi:MAG TPA: PspC domain-containing protein [Rhodanobacteraceae bacterium]|nr:PspC domain-containing protein [Rhodanobacteraceae bacterium]
MQTVTHVSLSGHSTPFQLDEDGYQSLRSYFERARSRLKRDPDRDEVLRDLEQSIGEKFVALLRGRDRIIAGHDVDSVLVQVGKVDLDIGTSPSREAQSFRPRRLCRILEGKWISGVCVGLAVYSSIGVDWVRAIFILATVFTGGVVILIYLGLMFALPVVQTHDEYKATLRSISPAM